MAAEATRVVPYHGERDTGSSAFLQDMLLLRAAVGTNQAWTAGRGRPPKYAPITLNTQRVYTVPIVSPSGKGCFEHAPPT